MEVVKEMKKIIRGNKCCILRLAYQQGQISERFTLNDKFINLVNQFGIIKSSMGFKISILKFLDKYPRMKKSSLTLLFLKNNLKIIEEICHENVSEFK